MRCDCCNGDGECMDMDWQISPCSECHGRGWLPFWTPAERAGLKALGLERDLNRDFGGDRDEEIIEAAICAYVKAAREEKKKS